MKIHLGVCLIHFLSLSLSCLACKWKELHCMISEVPSACWVRHMLLLGLHSSTKVVLVCRKCALNCCRDESITEILCPLPECPSLVPLEGVAEFHCFPWAFQGLVSFFPENESWNHPSGCHPNLRPIQVIHCIWTQISSPITRPTPMSSYWVKIRAPFRLWICWKKGRWALVGVDSVWMLTSNIGGCHVENGRKYSKIVTRGKLWLNVRGYIDTVLGWYKNFLTIPAILWGRSLSFVLWERCQTLSHWLAQ